MRLTARTILTTLLCYLTFSCAIAAETPMLHIQHASGMTDLPANPKKIIVLDLSVIDMLDALNIKITGVPSWKMPKELTQYESSSYLKVGSVFEPDYEAINAASPDLILIAGRTRDKYSKLSQIAPTLDLTTDFDHYYASVEQNARILGKVFGKQKEIEQQISHLESSLAKLHQLGEKAGSALAILTTGGKMSAFGEGSRFGPIYGEFGFKQADPSLKSAMHGQTISHEYILRVNPDWLFVVDRDVAIGNSRSEPAQKLLDNPLVAQTRAWKQKHIVYLNPSYQYVTSGSLRTEQAIVDEVTNVLTSR